jgi:amino-acid N-acetyltransferase
MPKTLKIFRTTDIDKLNRFFEINGLESAEDNLDDKQLIAAWAATDPAKENLAGALSLVKRSGYYIIDGIAVDQAFRKLGFGKALMKLALAEIKSLQGGKVYLVARVPQFFSRLGFSKIPWSEAPPVFECASCPQYEQTCHPEVMTLSL